MVYRLILSVIIALITTVLLQFINNGGINIGNMDTVSATAIFVACAITAIISPSISSTGNNNRKKPSSDNREQGTVKWFNVSKGYGFVTRSTGEDVFVHFRSINGKGRRILREGQTIAFSVTTGDKGPQAEDVDVL